PGAVLRARPRVQPGPDAAPPGHPERADRMDGGDDRCRARTAGVPTVLAELRVHGRPAPRRDPALFVAAPGGRGGPAAQPLLPDREPALVQLEVLAGLAATLHL